MFSPEGMDQKRARKGLAQPKAWHTGDVSALPEQGEACEVARVTLARQARPSSACIRTRAYEEHIRYLGYRNKYTDIDND